jgi:photosystem II stability/assembly factor-like uncharacterized protein
MNNNMMKYRLKSFFLLFLMLNTAHSQDMDMTIFHGMSPRNIGPAGMSGRITSIDVNLSDEDEIYIGTAAGGIWKSENRGHTWTPIFENEMAASIGAVTIYQKNPAIIYAGTGEGNPRNSQNSGWGIYKSMDAGKTWKHLGLQNTRQIHRVIVHPENSDQVVVGASGSTWGPSVHRGVFMSKDGGESWKQVLYVNEHSGISDLVASPHNPNIVLAAMWEHKRWPWFFKSGGTGSGIYISYDGGESWRQVAPGDGLPEGELGRIGLSFAPSKAGLAYAYVESKENAVYISEDYGMHWKRVSLPDQPSIGDRPFYYADIYVDVKNENRIYSLATTVNVSEDGGRTWSVFASGDKIHTDHHAFWAHPSDPDYLIIGHDGGLNITHDRGKNWWFADNLPLAQFYHIRADNEFPYNVMGGLQDNGSWIGPSQTWFKGGIRNMYWQRVSVGDGFDVVPDPLHPDYGYAMGQSGNLVRYHRPSGQLTRIKPVHPDGEYLRFNWNTGIAIDPIDKKTIYYGSQFLHKSSDYGASWEIISPDLTTNDPSKQEFLKSGGLTYDVTGAEFHTTIISIDPSPVSSDIIWVGTDDGNVQVTRDGGKSWSNTVNNIPDVPPNTWVTQITASALEAAEATVVFDDHRRDNWETYVYRTRNYGKSWERIADSADTRGYAFCYAQDPIEPRLQFLGTEFGLYVSFNKGENWQEWISGYPTMPTTDLLIHPREHDLVIGTFGRAIWILDDIRPLREIAQKGFVSILNRNIHLFTPPPTNLMVIGESHGYRHGKVGDALYNGENRPYGALITYYVNQEIVGDKDTRLEAIINDSEGKLIRKILLDAKPGINRFNWNLRADAVRRPGSKRTDPDEPVSSGRYVTPGTYKIELSNGDWKTSQMLEVRPDPRIEIGQDDLNEKSLLLRDFDDLVEEATRHTDDLIQIKENLSWFEKILSKDPELKEHVILDDMKKLIMDIDQLLDNVKGREVQGLYMDPSTLNSLISATSSILGHPLEAVTENQKIQFLLFKNRAKTFRNEVNGLKSVRLDPLQKTMNSLKFDLLSE